MRLCFQFRKALAQLLKGSRKFGQMCLSDYLSRESRVGKRLPARRATKHKEEELALPGAPVEAVGELLEVARQVLGADAMEGPAQPGLEVREPLVELVKRPRTLHGAVLPQASRPGTLTARGDRLPLRPDASPHGL